MRSSSPSAMNSVSGNCAAIIATATLGANSATRTIDPTMNWQNAIITRIETLSPVVKSFFFRLPEPISFRPGQHVLLRLTAPDGYRAQRSYSIASAPGPDKAEELELAIERFDDVEISPFMHDAAQVNYEIELGGPIGGHFNWSPEDGGPVL